MGAGLSIRNDSPLPLQVIISQLTPLHWNDRPLFTGETWNARNESNVGQVWFTASVDVFDDAAVPSRAGVAARVSGLTVGALFAPLACFVAGGAYSAATSVARGASMHRVKADGVLLVVRGCANARTGEYRLYFSSTERRDATGALYERTELRAPSGFEDREPGAVRVCRGTVDAASYVAADEPTAARADPAILHLRARYANARVEAAHEPPKRVPQAKDADTAEEDPDAEPVLDVDVFELEEAIPECPIATAMPPDAYPQGPDLVAV